MKVPENEFMEVIGMISKDLEFTKLAVSANDFPVHVLEKLYSFGNIAFECSSGMVIKAYSEVRNG